MVLLFKFPQCIIDSLLFCTICFFLFNFPLEKKIHYLFHSAQKSNEGMKMVFFLKYNGLYKKYFFLINHVLLFFLHIFCINFLCDICFALCKKKISGVFTDRMTRIQKTASTSAHLFLYMLYFFCYFYKASSSYHYHVVASIIHFITHVNLNILGT